MKLLDFWIRREACKMAAIAISRHDQERPITPHVWSVTVFFEMYMREGAEGTEADFGPKFEPELKIVPKGEAK